MYLGIDLGTSSIKVVICDDAYNVIAQADHKLTINRPRPLWSEQDPQQWWQALDATMTQLKQNHSDLMSEVVAIGLSGQQHGAVLLDDKGNVIRPAILWNDGRSMQQCEQLMQAVPNYEQIVGNVIMPGFTAPKLVWVKQYEPDNFARVNKVLLPKDYLRYRMSGVYASDMSDASGTAWLNIAERKWSDAMLTACDLTQKHMPELYEGSDATATVTPELAKQWGLGERIVIAGGAGDNAAAAMSINAIAPGSAFISLGTSGTYFVSEDKFSPNAQAGVHTFCHCLPNLWHQMNVHLSAASSLSWWAKACQESDVSVLLTEAEQQCYLDSDVIFLPYLSGERTPHIDPFAQAVFFGMTHDTSRATLTEAVLEGVAFNFAEGQKAMLASGTQINQIGVVGGGARSTYWGKIFATALNQRLFYYQDREVGAAVGAARLAYLAVNNVVPLSAFEAPVIETEIEPEQNKLNQFAEKQSRFEALYQNLKPLYRTGVKQCQNFSKVSSQSNTKVKKAKTY